MGEGVNKSLMLLWTQDPPHTNRALLDESKFSFSLLFYGSSFICFLFLSESVYSLPFSSVPLCLFQDTTIISGGQQWSH